MGKIEDLWKENYKANVANGVFHLPNVRSITTLVNSNSSYNKPVLLVAAGPSLEKNINIIKKYQNKFIILCADVVLYRLTLEGIVPDFVCSIDPNPAIGRFWEDINTKHLKLIAPTTFSPIVSSLWKGDIYLFNQYDTSSKEKNQLLIDLLTHTKDYGYLLNMFFVGATLLQVATIFKPSVVCLTGYDFCFSDDLTHCRGVLNKDLDYKLNPPMSDATHNNIKTSKLLLLYRKTFIGLCKEVVKKLGLTIINCTEGGILDEGACCSLEDIALPLQENINKLQLGKPKQRKRK